MREVFITTEKYFNQSIWPLTTIIIEGIVRSKDYGKEHLFATNVRKIYILMECMMEHFSQI